ncbi:MAG: hypothetical protein LAT55_06995 [Opitutales bacterium]|nr:hypothetical protein [Opitutales bacterium]
MKITHHFDQPSLPLSVEWRWTGFTPATLLLGDDMKQTLRYLGAVPRRGVNYLRIHYLLELVTVKNPAGERPVYDWSRLDEGFDVLIENNLTPFVELMGNPSGYFNDFKDPVQKKGWKQFVRDLALHVMDRYGREEVEKWYFETWNEPDLGWWKQDDEAFLIYYDGCSEGLKEANPKLRFGGPGTAGNLHPRLTKLLAHVDSGTNHYTGEKGVRMDFLSVHEKGAWFSKHDIPVSPEDMVLRTRKLLTYLQENHPRLLSLPLMNNECDPQVGWKDPHTWRATSYYPAIMTKGLLVNLQALVDEDGCNFVVFGNDNGFLGEWGQRTQLTRFARNGKEDWQFDFIKKPALSLMTGLSLLGDQRVPGTVESDGSLWSLGTTFGEEGACALMCRADNRPRTGDRATPVRHVWEGLKPGTYTRVSYRIDENHGNPYRVWEEDQPFFPGPNRLPPLELIKAMREQQELTADASPAEVEVGSDGRWEEVVELPLPGVHFTMLLRKEAFDEPSAIEGLRAEPYPGIHDDENILLTWTPSESRATHDAIVEWRKDSGAAWEKIPHPPILDGSLVHVREPLADGAEYRVRVVDVWGRESQNSEIVKG